MSNYEDSQKFRKDYSPVYWKLFTVGFVLHAFVLDSRFQVFSLPAVPVYLRVIFWGAYLAWALYASKVTSEALLFINRSLAGVLAILCLLPFGFYITFVIAWRSLKARGLWVAPNQTAA